MGKSETWKRKPRRIKDHKRERKRNLIVLLAMYTYKSLVGAIFKAEDYDLKVRLTSQFSDPPRRAKARRSRSAKTGGCASVAQARTRRPPIGGVLDEDASTWLASSTPSVSHPRGFEGY